MRVDLVTRMAQACGGPVSSVVTPFINAQADVLRRHDGSAVVYTNPLGFNAPGSEEMAKAYVLGHLLAENEGYVRDEMTECAIIQEDIDKDVEGMKSFSLREECVGAVTEQNVRRSMTVASSFLQRIAVNNIMAVDFGVDVRKEYYYLGDGSSFEEQASVVEEGLVRDGPYADAVEMPRSVAFRIGLPFLFLLENCIYQDKWMTNVLFGYRSTALLINEVLDGIGLAEGSEKALTRGFRSHYSPERYRASVQYLHEFLGRGSIFHPRMMTRQACDRQREKEATVAIESFRTSKEPQSVEVLLEAMEKLLRIQTIDVDDKVKEAYRLCLEKAMSKGVDLGRMHDGLLNTCLELKYEMAAIYFYGKIII